MPANIAPAKIVTAKIAAIAGISTDAAQLLGNCGVLVHLGDFGATERAQSPLC
jgi:hypothetical protein